MKNYNVKVFLSDSILLYTEICPENQIHGLWDRLHRMDYLYDFLAKKDFNSLKIIIKKENQNENNN